MSNIKLTVEGLRRVRSASIPYDTIEIDLEKGLTFKYEDCVVGTVGGKIEGEVITVSGLVGRVEVQAN